MILKYRCSFPNMSASRFLVMSFSLVLSNTAFSVPDPINKKEHQFLFAFNVFGYPGSGVTPPELHEAKSRGCIDHEGVLVQRNADITVDGFNLTCMIESGSIKDGNAMYIWMPTRYARYCDDFDSFVECANSKSGQTNSGGSLPISNSEIN
ncbi:MAG TPA: hypothetical protein VIC08_15195 [Cellvibrionaceae bacterium]